MAGKRGKYQKHKDNPTSFKPQTWDEYATLWLNEKGEQQCNKCQLWFPFNDFPPNKQTRFGKTHRCRTCTNEHARVYHAEYGKRGYVRDKARNAHFVATYGITLEEYEARLEAQGRACAICSVPLVGRQQTHLDHDHETGAIRAFLCTNCNRGLGHFQDNEELLMNAATYLQAHGKEGSRP